MVDAARGVLNDFLPDVWVYTDHCKAMLGRVFVELAYPSGVPRGI